MGVIIFHPQQEYFLFDECQEAEKKNYINTLCHTFPFSFPLMLK
jgi:hypothetical protein